MTQTFLRLRKRIHSFFFPSARQDDLDLEITAHLDLLAADYMQEGMSESEAKKAAKKRFGATEVIKEECRDSWGTRVVHEFARDIQFAFRLMKKQWGGSLIIVFILALCIGTNATVFKWYRSVFMSDFAFPHSERIYYFGHNYAKSSPISFGMCIPSYLDVVEHSKSFEKTALIECKQFTFQGEGDATIVYGSRVTEHAFDMMGNPLLLGSGFDPESFIGGEIREIVLSHQFWREQFDEDIGIIGKSVTIDGAPLVVVGIARADFVPLHVWTNFWIPFPFSAQEKTFTLGQRGEAIGLVKEGVSRAQVNEDMKQVFEVFKGKWPRIPPIEDQLGLKIKALPLKEKLLTESYTFIAQNAKMFQWACALVLIVGVFNIAGLFSVKLSLRRGEISMRAALGGSRRRLFRQLITECFLYVFIGTILGVIFSELTTMLLARFEYFWSPFSKLYLNTHIWNEAVDVCFISALALIATLFLGSISYFKILRLDLSGNTQDLGSRTSTGRKRLNIGNFYIVGQYAGTIVLLIVGLISVDSFFRANHTDLGFNSNKLSTGKVVLQPSIYPTNSDLQQFIGELEASLISNFGEGNVGIINRMPFVDQLSNMGVSLDGKDIENGEYLAISNYYVITPDFPDLIGMKLLSGRLFDGTDSNPDARSVLINKGFADKHFPEGGVIGKRIFFGDLRYFTTNGMDDEIPWYTVVGVVADFNHSNTWTNDRQLKLFYTHKQFPYSLDDHRTMTVVVKSPEDPVAVTNRIREAVNSVDSGVPLVNTASMDSHISQAKRFQRRQMIIMLSLSAITVLLSLVSVYGSTMAWVQQRRRSIGIRIALGATRKKIGKMVLREGVPLIVLGCLIGLMLSKLLTKYLPNLHQNTDVNSIGFYIVGTILLLAVSLPIIIHPMFRAMRIDPMQELKYE